MMGSISDYADLLFAVGDQTGYTDLSAVMPRLVRAAETKLQRDLRVAPMENTATVQIYNGSGKLPCDFMEIRDCRINGRKMESIAQRAIGDTNIVGTPRYFYIVGDKIKTTPIGNATMTMTYYKKIPSLVEDGTNWLLGLSGEIYLYAVAKEVGIYKRNPELSQAMDVLLQGEIAGLRKEDERARWGYSKMVVQGVNP